MNALSYITRGRASSPSGSSIVSQGMLPLGMLTPNPNATSELGVCDLDQEAGSFLPQAKRGVWQNLEGKSLSTKGGLSTPFTLINPDCQVGIIQTEHGPLTKGYGDAQLAGIDDVVVRVEGVLREVTYVNPTLGIIVLARSIQPGCVVEVDYHYTNNAILPFESFNSLGHTWNKLGSGSAYSGAFNYSLKGNIGTREKSPALIGHTFTAFDSKYSAAFNDPTSLVFNEPSHSLTIDPLSHDLSPAFISYEGSLLPESTGWISHGNAPQTFSSREGLFEVADTSTSVSGLISDPLMYTYNTEFPQDYVSTLNVRTKVFEYQKDGDFSGVSFGWTSKDTLYKISFLDVGGVLLIAMLGQEDETSWKSYLGIDAEITPRTVNGIAVSDRLILELEPGYIPGDSVWVSGQIYDVGEILIPEDFPDKFEVRLDRELTQVSGAVQVYYVLDYTQLTSYRVLRNESGTTRVYTSGNPSPIINVEDFNLPSQHDLYDLVQFNQMYFGGVSKLATSSSGWGFYRHNIQPTSSSVQASRVYVDSVFTQLPQELPETPWTILDDQGNADIVGSSLTLLQGGSSSSGTLSYGRIEPLLQTRSKLELQARFRVDSYVRETIPVTITIADREREITLAVMSGEMFTSGTDYASYRITQGVGLQDVPSMVTEGVLSPAIPLDVSTPYIFSYTGTKPLEDEGWSSNGASSYVFKEHHAQLVKPSGGLSTFSRQHVHVKPSDQYEHYMFSAGLRVDHADLTIMSTLPMTLGVDDASYEVFITLMKSSQLYGVAFTTRSGALLATILGDPLGFAFDWDDQAFHSYRVVRSGDVVTLFVDGAYLGSVSTTDLQSSTQDEHTFLLDLGQNDILLSIDHLTSYSTEYGPRMLGLYLGGDPTDPSSYETQPVEFLGTFLDLRVTQDPAGKLQVFVNDSVSSVFEKQYAQLPLRTRDPELNTGLGFVRFGSLDPKALSISVWEFLRYNITNEREQQVAKQHSLFNHAIGTTSYEPYNTQEALTLNLILDTEDTLQFSSKGYNVRSVLSVKSLSGNFLDFTFSEGNQSMTLVNPLSQSREEVRLTILVKGPYSRAYLDQLLPWVRLNEGTPSFESSQGKVLRLVEEFNANLEDVDASLNPEIDYTYEDGRLRVSFAYDEDSFFNCLNTHTKQISGSLDTPLSIACDGGGWLDFSLEYYEDFYTLPESFGGLGSYVRPFKLDQLSSLLDRTDTVLDPLSVYEVLAEYSNLHEDLVNAPTDGLPSSGVMVILDGFILDSNRTLLDSSDSLLEDFTTQDVLLNFTSSYTLP